MRTDPTATRARRRLLEEIMGVTGGQARLDHHIERGWTSVTFAGTRHTMTLQFTGHQAVAAGENFVALLPEHQFAIPSQLVADAAVTSVDQEVWPIPRLSVTIELLLLDEAG